jgi:hypothetical protein
MKEDGADNNNINNSNFIVVVADVTVVSENRMLRRNLDPRKGG